MRSRVALPTKMRSRRTRFPPVDTSPRYTLPSDPMDDDDLKSIGGGSRVHCYRDNTSIFSDSLYGHPGIIFPQTKRMLPWEEILEKGGSGGGVIHAYASARSSLLQSTAIVAPGLEQWRRVGEQHRRKRPPPEAKKRAMPGSTLDKKRTAMVEAQAAAQRARVGSDDEPPRVSILRGGSSSMLPGPMMAMMPLAPAASVSAPQIIYPRQSLPKLL